MSWPTTPSATTRTALGRARARAADRPARPPAARPDRRRPDRRNADRRGAHHRTPDQRGPDQRGPDQRRVARRHGVGRSPVGLGRMVAPGRVVVPRGAPRRKRARARAVGAATPPAPDAGQRPVGEPRAAPLGGSDRTVLPTRKPAVASVRPRPGSLAATIGPTNAALIGVTTGVPIGPHPGRHRDAPPSARSGSDPTVAPSPHLGSVRRPHRRRRSADGGGAARPTSTSRSAAWPGATAIASSAS